MSKPTTHDYGPGKRGWGHDYAVTEIKRKGLQIRATGWGRGLKSKDFMIFEHQSGATSRYKIKEIEYYSNPTDMWSGVFDFAPRK